MGRANHDAVRRDAALFGNLCTRIEHDLTRDDERVRADKGDAALAVIEHRSPHFAGIMESAMEGLAVAAGLLHPKGGSDVALGEASFDVRSGRRGRRRGGE